MSCEEDLLSTLPVLLSIPHGGTAAPEELRDRICITPRDLFDDGDAFTLDIYDLGDGVARVVKTDMARAFVDVNRAPDDRPPANPDGVVKSATCLGKPIYLPGREPDDALTERLLERYHRPYHSRLAQAASDPRVTFALDCHSMLPVAPPVRAQEKRTRPLFCLSNRDGATAPNELLEKFAAAIAEAFRLAPESIGLNDPFKGGFITRNHGGGRLPWIQVEMNRRLYLDEPWFDRHTLRIDPGRLADLREAFRSVLHRMTM